MESEKEDAEIRGDDMTWKYAMRECKMHIVMSVLCFVQALFLFSIVIGMVSIFMMRYSEYQPVQNLVEQKGFICNMVMSYHIDGDSEGKMVENSEAYEDMLKEASVYGQYNVSAFVGNENQEIKKKREEGSYFSNLRAYDDELINGFEPKMQSGNWLKQENMNGSELEAVVLQNSDKYKVGDITYIEDNNSETKLKTKIPVKIIGVIAQDADIIYQSGKNRSSVDYHILFSNMVTETEDLKKIDYVNGINNFNPETFFVSKKNLDSVQEEYAAKESEDSMSDNYENVLGSKKEIFSTGLDGIVIITMDKKCSDEVFKYNKNRIAQISQFNFLHDLEYIKKNTWHNIMANISELVPVGAGMILFTVISFVTLSTLMYQKNMRKYSIYYMYGLTWKDIFNIHILYIFMLIFAAFIFGILAIYVIGYLGVLNIIAVQIGAAQIVSCIVVMILLMLAASLMCFSLVNGRTAEKIMQEVE